MEQAVEHGTLGGPMGMMVAWIAAAAGLAWSAAAMAQGAAPAAPAGQTAPSERAGAKPQAGSAAAPIDWRAAEAPVLTDHVALTTHDRFIKAGEAYFNADGTWIIFQAIAVPPEGQAPEPFYQMYVAKLVRDGSGRITGTDEPIRLSAPGTSNTCGWFHPAEPGVVMFGSTLVKPALDDVPGYQRTTGRYVWQFHSEMTIVRARFDAFEGSAQGESGALTLRSVGIEPPTPIFTRPGYCAEGSWSGDGRLILYANFDRARSEALGRNHLDILIYDSRTKRQIPIVTADGYNGGPFFSPDGRAITYRSDRKGDSHLQIFVAKLAFDGEGVPTGIEREFQLTSNEHVNWAPFWHPSGRFLVYASSEVGHRNYEVFAVPVDFAALEAGLAPAQIPHARITRADGADVLPAFSADGQWMMWTGQRAQPSAGEDRPSSQLWVARFNADGVAFNK